MAQPIQEQLLTDGTREPREESHGGCVAGEMGGIVAWRQDRRLPLSRERLHRWDLGQSSSLIVITARQTHCPGFTV